MQRPLADRIRPQTLQEVVGQQHLLGKNKMLQRMIVTSQISNMIFYGPPGTGKTTVAHLIAAKTNRKFYKLNATHASVKDIQAIVSELDSMLAMNGVLLYLDEIQNFNKKQQQSLLDFMENGKITLIASTTENPYFYVYKAILSRATVFEFKLLHQDDIVKALNRALKIASEDLPGIKIICKPPVFSYIAAISNGDLRRAINALELAVYSTQPDKRANIHITLDVAKECTQEKVLNYDKWGDSHYDVLSAFQKSIRGSDVDASLHYLARLIKAEDIASICRRLLIITSEDIGMAYPNAITIVKSCVDSAMQVGLPEARINLAQAVILLATAPKSNTVIKAIDAAMQDIESKDTGDIPSHLKDSHYSGAKHLGNGVGYQYPHAYSQHYVVQQYLPDSLKDAVYYTPAQNKIEKGIREYWQKIKENKKA